MSSTTQPRTPTPSRGAALAAPRPAQRSIITPAGEQALRDELDRLRDQLKVGFAGRLRDARAFGEAAGNDEYLQIKEEAAILTAAIVRLEGLLASATVVEENQASIDVAAIGSIVAVSDLDSGKVTEHELIGGYEPLTAKSVSANSPIGSALMGRRVGDEVEVELPDERTRRLRIAAVHPPARA